MKIKHPESVWVGFGDDPQVPFVVENDKKAARGHGEWNLACYRLSPGNEVARALNVIFDKNGYKFQGPTSSPLIGDIMRSSGVNVRWDAKKGRFA